MPDRAIQRNARTIARTCLEYLRDEIANARAIARTRPEHLRDSGPQLEHTAAWISQAQSKAHSMLIGARTMAFDVDQSAYDMLDGLAREVLTDAMRDNPAETVERLLVTCSMGHGKTHASRRAEAVKPATATA